MSGTTEVAAALRARLVAASPGAALAASSVAWENLPFTPTAGTRWYDAHVMTGKPLAAAISEAAANRHVGVFHVNVYDPAGTGEGAAAAEAERIAACFKRGTVLTYSGVSVHIERAYIERGLPQADPAWFQVPVVIEWRADVAN
jgi:hypothetical protein